MNFSMDMVRLEVLEKVCNFDMFCKIYFSKSSDVEEWICNDIKAYKHNVKIEESFELGLPSEFLDKKRPGRPLGVNKFWLGYWHNSEELKGCGHHKKSSHKLVIEFNPNKCDIREGLLNKVLKMFFSDYIKVSLKSCDICLDLHGIHIDDMVYSKELKRRVVDYMDNGGRTMYFGERGSNGSVKVYDKAAEQKADKVWTRWETTLKFSELPLGLAYRGAFKISGSLPTVYFKRPFDYDSLDVDAKLKSALICVHKGYMKLEDFDYRYRQKIKTHLGDTSYIVIDETVKPDIHKTIVTYFVEYARVFDVVREKRFDFRNEDYMEVKYRTNVVRNNRFERFKK